MSGRLRDLEDSYQTPGGQVGLLRAFPELPGAPYITLLLASLGPLHSVCIQLLEVTSSVGRYVL